ncbi:hypothetical protein Ddc_22604 [Ditylenchus destructor]|nr:hypothetical protein Ddc_22604 [Ditylenchus destructor]
MGERVVQRRAHRRHLRVVALLWRRDTLPGPAALCAEHTAATCASLHCCGVATCRRDRPHYGGQTRLDEVVPAAGRQSQCPVVAGQRPALPINDGRARNPAPSTPPPPARRCTAVASRHPAGTGRTVVGRRAWMR